MDYRIPLMFFLNVLDYEVKAQLSYIRVQAPTEVRYKKDKLVLACDPQNVDSTDGISDIIIQKNSNTGWRDVVKVLSDISTGTLQQKVVWSDINMQNRALVVTSIVAPSANAGLQIEVSPVNVSCSDEGTYRCEINGNRGGGGKLDSQSISVDVKMTVEPLSINPINVKPMQSENIYNPNTVLTLTCYGDVGNPPAVLRWCYKRSNVDWYYMGYPYFGDITQEAASMTDCQYRRTSTLRYTVSEYVDQVDFRCETGGVTTQCGHISAIAANVTIHRYKDNKVSSQSYVRIEAPSEVRYKLDKLVIACDPENVSTTDVITNIIIQKNSTTDWTDIVMVEGDLSTGTLQQKVSWTDSNIQSRANVINGMVAPTVNAGLQIEVNAAFVACSDEGLYRCVINGNGGSRGKLNSYSNPIQVRMKVEPLSINPITVNPLQAESIYFPQTILTLTCNGDFGNPPADLRWCYKRSGIDLSYTGYPDADDITQGEVSMNDCQYRRSSTLRYTVSDNLDQVDFLCETGGVSTQCGHTSSIAANFTLYRYKAKDPKAVTFAKEIFVPNAAVLSCDIAVGQVDSVRWFKDSQDVDVSDNSRYSGGTTGNPDLIIKSVLKIDEGIYVCEVSDEGVLGRTERVFLSVSLPGTDSCNCRPVIIALSVLLSIVAVALASVLFLLSYQKYNGHNRDSVYDVTKHGQNNSDYAFDNINFPKHDSSTSISVTKPGSMSKIRK